MMMDISMDKLLERRKDKVLKEKEKIMKKKKKKITRYQKKKNLMPSTYFCKDFVQFWA